MRHRFCPTCGTGPFEREASGKPRHGCPKEGCGGLAVKDSLQRGGLLPERAASTP